MSRTVLQLQDYSSVQLTDQVYLIRGANSDGRASIDDIISLISSQQQAGGYTTPQAVRNALASLPAGQRLGVEFIENAASVAFVNQQITGLAGRLLPAAPSLNDVPQWNGTAWVGAQVSASGLANIPAYASGSTYARGQMVSHLVDGQLQFWVSEQDGNTSAPSRTNIRWGILSFEPYRGEFNAAYNYAIGDTFRSGGELYFTLAAFTGAGNIQANTINLTAARSATAGTGIQLSDVTAAVIVSRLTSLTGNARLPITAIRFGATLPAELQTLVDARVRHADNAATDAARGNVLLNRGTLDAANTAAESDSTVPTSRTVAEAIAAQPAGGLSQAQVDARVKHADNAATTGARGNVQLADLNDFSTGALAAARRTDAVTAEDLREIFGLGNAGQAVSQPQLVRATNTKEGMVRISSGIADDNAQNNVKVPTTAQVRAAIAAQPAGGLSQAEVDARVKSSDNEMTTTTFGVGQLASGSDARALQPNDSGLVNVDALRQVIAGIPTGTQLSAAATDFHRKLGVEHTAGEIEYHGGFTKAWELTITDRPNRTGTFAGDTDGLTLTGGNIRGETAKQYGIWGFRAAGPLVTLNATLVQWTDTDSAGSNVGRIWISTNSAGRLLIHNPSDPTQSTLVASADRTSGFRFSTQDSLGFASQIAVEVLKLNPDDPTDDGIEFLPTVIRADGTVTQCNNIAFTSGWARFNTRRVHLFETAGTIPIDRVKFALHAGYESHAAFAAQLAGNADTAVAWGIRTAGAGRNTPDYTGDFDFAGRLKSEDADGVLQLVVGDNDSRLLPDPKDATDGNVGVVRGGVLTYEAPAGGGGGGGTLGGEYEAIVTTRVNQNGNWQSITLPSGRSLTDYAAFEAAFDGTVVDGPVVGNISYDTVLAAGTHGAEIAFGLGANGFGSLRIQSGVLQWSIRNNAGHIAANSAFGLISLRGLRLAEIPADGGGTGATTFAALTDTPTAEVLRTNSGEHLIVNQTGDRIVTQSHSAAVRDGVQTAGVGQTEVDNRVKSSDNAATLTTRGNVELATTLEAVVGTDAARAMTPVASQAAINNRIVNTAIPASGGSTTNAPSVAAVRAAIAAVPSGGGGGNGQFIRAGWFGGGDPRTFQYSTPAATFLHATGSAATAPVSGLLPAGFSINDTTGILDITGAGRPVMQLNWEQAGIDFSVFAGRATFTSGNNNIVMFYFGQSAASRGSSSRERPQAALTSGMGIGLWTGPESGNGTFWIIREDTNQILNVNAATPVWLDAAAGTNFNDATGVLPLAQKPTAGTPYNFTAIVLKHRIRVLLGANVLFDGFMPERTDAQLKATVAGSHFGVYGSWRNTSSIAAASISDVLPTDMI